MLHDIFGVAMIGIGVASVLGLIVMSVSMFVDGETEDRVAAVVLWIVLVVVGGFVLT